MQTITKDPDATLDYGWDWAAEDWLGTDTIVSSEWTVPDGITKEDESNTDTKTVVWLSGGTLTETYKVTNRITTSGGRTDDRSFSLFITQR